MNGRALATIGALLLGLLPAAGATAAARSMPATGQRALLEKYCLSCHNYVDNAGGFELEVFDPRTAHRQAQTTEKMLRKLRAGMMPPAGEPRPDMQALTAFVESLENTIDRHAARRVGAPTLHRLNRTEYGNAVRDLLGLALDPTQFLPADDSSKGFDNQAGTLTLSPALLDAYLTAAARISRLALGLEDTPTQVTYRIAEDANQNYHIDGLPFGTRGGLAIEHYFPADGKYTFKVFSVNLGNMGNFRPFGEIRGEQLLAYIDGRQVARVNWDDALGVNRPFDDEGGGQLRTIDITLPVKAGPRRIGIAFAATNYAPGLDLNRQFERSTIETGGLPGFTFYPHIGSLRIDGPYEAVKGADSPSRARVMICRPAQASEEEACARRIASALARRAYRGYATPANIETLLQFYSQGRRQGGFDDGIEAVVQRVLADPKFIYRIEAQPARAAGDAWRIADLDLASRLSFFLWSSIPDDELLQLAGRGELGKTAVLRKVVRRMLADPRAVALTENFAGQWLALRNLSSHAPVVDQFPDFDDNLRQAFRRETELLFNSVLEEDRSVMELLTADYTFLNERLAKHYGIPGIRGSHFRRVQLDAAQASRFGLLGKGAVLTVSSQPGRTSPVIRGNWVLKHIIGVPAPDPPPDVPDLKPTANDAAGNARVPSMREQLSVHRSNPACLGCHKLMDPIGFALEPFDAVGRLRTEDAGNPIDARDEMYDGTAVDGPAGVRNFLLRYQDQYLRNVVQNLLTYALGRGIEYDDMPTVRRIVRESAREGYRLRSMIEAIVLSDVFRMNAAPSQPATLAAQHAGGQ